MGELSGRIGLAFMGNALAPIVSLVTAPILARALGAEGRGELAAAIAPLVLGTTIATLGLPTAATYFVAKAPAVSRFIGVRASLILMASGAVTSIVIYWASGWLSQGESLLRGTIVLAGLLVVPTMLVVLLQGIAAGLNAWPRILFERVTSATLRLAGLVALFASDRLTPTTAVAVMTISPLVGAIAYVGIFPRRSCTKAAPISGVMHFSMRIWIGSLSGILLSRLDQALMTPLSSTKELGYYAVAVSLAELALIANTSIREVMFADLATRFDRRRMITASRLSTVSAAMIAVPMAIGVVFFLPALFGDEFSPAVPVTVVLLLAVIVSNPGSMAGVGLSALGMPGRRSINLVIATLVNVILVILLAPRWGAMGAAMATLIANSVSSNLCIISLWRSEGSRPTDFYRFRLSDVRRLLGAAEALRRP